MKKSGILALVAIGLILLIINFVYAENSNENLPLESHGTFYKTIKIDKDNSGSQTVLSSSKARLLSTQSAPNHINIREPETPGYYYITDKMLIEIDTAYPSTCTYSFNEGPWESMVDNETYHYKSFPGLLDNMDSDYPYVVDFSCNDGSHEAATNYTYFWINTSYLDLGLFRNDLGTWIYKNSEYNWLKDDGFEGYYESYYYKENKKELITEVDVLVFDNEESLQRGVKKYFIDYYGNNLSVQTINNKNFYKYDGKYVKMLAWKSGNYLVGEWVIRYNDSSPTNFQVPEDILTPYLEKYPNDLRFGTCGDGNTHVLNLDGNKEECDKNSETVSCGSSVGECRAGKKTRKCNLNCTWQNYGVCNSTNPKTDVCDGKDNDCDGKIDEDFSLLNQTCYVGVGACKQEGKYVCSLAGLNLTCNTFAKTPQKEDCNDKIDNDCDGKIDFFDSECTSLKINSPGDKTNYPSKTILLDIYSDITPNDLVYSYIDYRGKKVTVKLCSKCNTYNKTRSFNDGEYNLTIGIVNKSQILTNKTIFFLVDSTLPKITKTLPKSGFTNGNFTIEFKEANPKSLILYYDKYNKSASLNKDCVITKDIETCSIKVNVSSMNGKEINYSFNITDISGNRAGTKRVKLIVDTTIPVLNNPNSFWKKDLKYPQNINFNLSVSETNFASVVYIDSFDGAKAKWNTLCNKLSKNNECTTKKNLKKGVHNLKVQVIDKAGNFIQKEVKIEV